MSELGRPVALAANLLLSYREDWLLWFQQGFTLLKLPVK
jgi:hypothetical protein